MNGKTIDDIIRESDIISALSAMSADATNVDTRNSMAGPQTFDLPSVDLAYQERAPEIRQTRLKDYTGISGEELVSMMGATAPVSASASLLKSLLGRGAKEPMKLLTSGGVQPSSAKSILGDIGKLSKGKVSPDQFLSKADRDIIAKAYQQEFNYETYVKAQSALKRASDLASKYDKGIAKAFQDLNELLKLSAPKSIPLPGKVLR